MEVALVTAGSRGDVEPFLALGEALAARGHRVRLLAPEGFESLFEGSPVAYRPAGPDPRRALDEAGLRRLFAAGSGGLAFVRELIRAFERAAPAFLEALDRELPGSQAVVFGSLGFWAWSWAEAHRVPAFPALLQPLLPTRAFPAPVGPVPRLARLGALNRLSYRAAERLAWALVARPTNAYRRRLGLRPYGLAGPYPELAHRGVPVLLGVSPHVVPRPRDWPARYRLTGYWFRRPRPWRPPPGLARFLDREPRPVYLGFGSMRPPEPGRVFRRVLEALRRVGVPAVVARGWAGAAIEPADDLYLLDEVPHSWLLPRVAAAVHHGGAGTSAAVFRAGVPGVWVPFLADQFFWAERARALGVAPAPVPARRLDADRLAAALRAALRPEPRARARALAARLAGEDGAARAAEILEKEVRLDILESRT